MYYFTWVQISQTFWVDAFDILTTKCLFGNGFNTKNPTSGDNPPDSGWREVYLLNSDPSMVDTYVAIFVCILR